MCIYLYFIYSVYIYGIIYICWVCIHIVFIYTDYIGVILPGYMEVYYVLNIAQNSEAPAPPYWDVNGT